MKLSKTRIKAIRDDGIYSDDSVTGLKLRVRDGRKYWIFRRSVSGKRYEISIGTDDLEIETARDIATKLRCMTPEEFVAFTTKPADTEEEKATTFAEVEQAYYKFCISSGNFEAGDKYDQTRYYVVRKFILPAIGDREINSITAEDVAKILISKWDTPSTVDRICFQMKEIFNWAKSRKLFTGSNPADNKGDLKFLLPKKRKEKRNHGMLPLHRVAHFCRALWLRGGADDLMFLFAIVTCVRSHNAITARWDQINIEEKTWTISAMNMKIKSNGGIVIPLSEYAISILERVGVKSTGWIFPKQKTQLPYASSIFRKVVVSMNKTADRLGYDRWIDEDQTRDLGEEILATQHGISRACFRTWASSDEYDNDLRYNERVIEACLHHAVDDGYRGAYDRGKRLIRKRELLTDWGKFCFAEIEKEREQV